MTPATRSETQTTVNYGHSASGKAPPKAQSYIFNRRKHHYSGHDEIGDHRKGKPPEEIRFPNYQTIGTMFIPKPIAPHSSCLYRYVPWPSKTGRICNTKFSDVPR